MSAHDTVVLATRPAGVWELELLPERLAGDLQELVAGLRQSGGGAGAIGFASLDDEVFVAVRVAGGGVGSPVRLLLSDVSAALAYDLAADVLDELGIDPPDDDDDGGADAEEVWPAGYFSIFADLGVDELELTALLSDVDEYADVLLGRLAGLLGFGDLWGRVVEPAMR